jgi:hypothetical protein
MNTLLPDLSRSVPPIVLMMTLALSGCNTGYKVDTSRNTVTWVTWDEGNGTREWPVDGADAKTFQVMPIRSNSGRQEFGRDKAHVYRESKKIEGAIPDSFRELGPRTYRDDKSVFRWVDFAITQLPNSDPETWREIDMLWSRDSTRVFFEDRGFVPRDIDSFETLAGGWAQDRSAIYYANSEIPKADRDTFKVIGEWGPFGKDRAHVFWRGWLIDGAQPESFMVSSPKEGHDNETSFYFILRDRRVCGPVYPAREILEILQGPVDQTIGDGKP